MANYIGEIRELKQKNKKILYIIFDPSPSSIVRAETYMEHFTKNFYKVKFYKCYSILLMNLEKKIAKLEIGFITGFFAKLNLVAIRVKKFYLLFLVNNYSGIVIIKYTTYEFINRIRRRSSAKLLYDFDDAVWLKNFFGLNQFENIIKAVDYVSCDNDYLADKALQFNPNTFVVKGPSQIEKFVLNSNLRNGENIIIGWVGSPHTVFYLYAIYDVLERIGSQYNNVVLRIVGSGNDINRIPYFEKIKYELVPYYDEPKMIEEVSKFDIGIYPLFNNELSYGRGFLKATIYMSAAVPVICTNNKITRLLVKEGENGFLASDFEEWHDKLSALIENKKLRQEIGKAAQKDMIEDFCIDKCFIDLESCFLNKL